MPKTFGAECAVLIEELERIAEGGAHVLDGDAIAGAHLLDGHAAGEAAHQGSDRHAGTAHDGLTAQDIWLSLQSFAEIHAVQF